MAKRTKNLREGMEIVHGPWEGQEGPVSTELVPAKLPGDSWERIEAQAREDMLHKGRLFWAVESMKREQAHAKPEQGAFGDGQRCDLCGCVARFAWFRTAKEVKRIERTKKLRGSALPISYRCSAHVPYFAPELAEQYRDARVSVADGKAA